MSLSILPECFADTLLMEILGYKRANHCSTIGDVANTMQKNYRNRLAIGIVDKDKPGKTPSYFNKFVVVEKFGTVEFKG